MFLFWVSFPVCFAKQAMNLLQLVQAGHDVAAIDRKVRALVARKYFREHTHTRIVSQVLCQAGDEPAQARLEHIYTRAYAPPIIRIQHLSLDGLFLCTNSFFLSAFFFAQEIAEKEAMQHERARAVVAATVAAANGAAAPVKR